jgi:hypothetical protein
MSSSTTVRRRIVAASALLIAVATAAVAPQPATAAPPSAPLSRAPAGQDDEGGTESLRKQLDDASRGYLEAQEALEASKKRQGELNEHLKTLDAELVTRSAAMGEIADGAYRAGRLGPVSALLDGGGPSAFLERASSLQVVAVKQDRAVRQVTESRTADERSRQALDLEIANQEKQLKLMDTRKQQAENALKVAGGGGATQGPSGNSAKSKSAPRNANGSLSDESCSVDDPTTSGCITPRTLFAMNQAKADGFNHFVSCFRPSGGGEHPKGRACDFAADEKSFGGVATGSDKQYGDNLANYFINNASNLGVLYVIWFERIWLPSSGWKTYSRGQGDPSSDHTNHVHLSMR